MSSSTIANDQECQGLDCSKPAKLQCPSCLKLNIPGSFFCSQDCFKKNWPNHKLVHLSVGAGAASDNGTSPTNPFPGFEYTGSLRPKYPLGERRALPPTIARPDYADTGFPLSEAKEKASRSILVMKPDEIEAMRKVGRLAREVLDIGARAIRVGITTDEIDRIIHEACIERDAYPSPLNYHKFPKSCCTSVNEVICHGIPDQRPLEDGDILNIDVTLYHGGFHGDLNETYLVGNVDKRGRELVQNARECLDAALALVKPGALYRDFGQVIDKHARSKGFSVVKTYCGHGIHRYFHCAPDVPHYARNKAVGVLKPGHIFTIEPMINEGTWRDEHWPDNWTAVTADGKRSAQFEHTILVTETGYELLTARLEDSP
ncbi:peptidase M24, structural domain-containing protein [Piptocephalis cylindrospora]|uniref:Methionine aminopeptidase n=1 Tax=Piptocephalis cylindrospora TaxID=1907219 RepID=A0A4P9Y7B1_9FUNG|nr:peptidase M24, structural domain-containing protein [Piptocephalis cylindrospora]|eukprot:RKP14121.1 peptidase M24, structural domain-containing protein [Piptocephalis cylindrospora]